jgi:hypothetical protein
MQADQEDVVFGCWSFYAALPVGLKAKNPQNLP